MQRKNSIITIIAAILLAAIGLGILGWTLYKSQVLVLDVAEGNPISLEAGIDPVPEGEA